MFNILGQFFDNQYAAINPIRVFSLFFLLVSLRRDKIDRQWWKKMTIRRTEYQYDGNIVIIFIVVLHTKYLFDNIILDVENGMMHASLLYLSNFYGFRCHESLDMVMHTLFPTSASFFFDISNYRKMSIDILKVERYTNDPWEFLAKTISTSYDMHESTDKCHRKKRRY